MAKWMNSKLKAGSSRATWKIAVDLSRARSTSSAIFNPFIRLKKPLPAAYLNVDKGSLVRITSGLTMPEYTEIRTVATILPLWISPMSITIWIFVDHGDWMESPSTMRSQGSNWYWRNLEIEDKSRIPRQSKNWSRITNLDLPSLLAIKATK